MPSPEEQPSPRKGGIQFKPWPLPDFLVSLTAVALMFAFERFLPKGTISFSALMGGSMAGMTMSYLSYCGYSIWTSPAKTKLVLVLVFVSVCFVVGGVSQMILGPNV